MTKLFSAKWILLLIVITTLVIKLSLFAMYYHGPDQIFRWDSSSYITPALFLLQSGHYLQQHYMSMHIHPLFFRTPGYPTFIFAVFYLFGIHIANVVYAQLLLSVISVICGYFIAKRLFNETVGLFAALLVSIDYLISGYSYIVLTDYFAMVLLSVVYLFGVLALTEKKASYINVLLLGLFIALATLTRPINYFLILPVAVGLFAYFISQRFSWRQIGLLMTLLMIPTVLLIGGWQLRNKLTMNTFRYSGISGAAGFMHYFPKNYQLYMRQQHDKKPILNIKQDIKIVMAYPKLAVQTVAQGFIRLMLGTDHALLQVFGSPEDNKAFFTLKHDLRIKQINTIWQFIHQHPQQWPASLYFVSALSMNLLLYCFLCVAIIGLIKDRSQRDKLFAHLFLIGCLLYFVAFSANAAAYARFRLPFQLIIDIYATYGLLIATKAILKHPKATDSAAQPS